MPTVPASLLGTEWTRLPTSQRVVALTFDCGSGAAALASILATLQQENVPATFFLTGDWTRAYPDRARQIARHHRVGNHTDTHPHLPDIPGAAIRREITGAEATIRSVTGQSPRPLFRFPYGDRTANTIRIANELGYGAIRWTVDTLGWQGTASERSAQTVLERVMDALQPGMIVLMHAGAARDGSTFDADALPEVIKRVRARGYRFVLIDAYL